MSQLTHKLNPKRFPGMSPLMAAIVGFVLGESFTDPEIAEISVSESEGFVYIRKDGAAGFDGFQSLEAFATTGTACSMLPDWNRRNEAKRCGSFWRKLRRSPGRNCDASGSFCRPYRSHCTAKPRQATDED